MTAYGAHDDNRVVYLNIERERPDCDANVVDIGSPIAHKVSQVAPDHPDAPSIMLAEKQLAEMAAVFKEQLCGQLDALCELYDDLSRLPADDGNYWMPAFTQKVLHINEQVQTFGDAPSAMVTGGLCEFLRNCDVAVNSDLVTIGQFLNLIRSVLQQRRCATDRFSAR